MSPAVRSGRSARGRGGSKTATVQAGRSSSRIKAKAAALKAEEEKRKTEQLESEEKEEDEMQESSSLEEDVDNDDGDGDGNDDDDDDGDDDDVDSEDEDSSDDDEDEDIDSEDEFELLETKSQPSSRGNRAPRGQGKGKGASSSRRDTSHGASRETENDGDESLFTLVKEGRTVFKALADDWIDEYKKDKNVAMTTLLQFIVRCCGCQATVTQEMAVKMTFEQCARQLTVGFEEVSSDYPLTMSGVAWKKFKNNFVDFIDLLIRQCQHSLVYDNFLLDCFVSWLVSLSSSQVRAFRHTSTLAGVKLLSTLISVAKTVHIELDNAQRQLDLERRKEPTRRSGQRIDALEGRHEELKDNIHDLEDYMQQIFSGIFLGRYRDIVPEIRALCMDEIGVWITNYSSTFLADNYLKYVGWMLYDRVGDVRMKAVMVLEQLYANEAFHTHLDLFTHKFKDRIVQMVQDKEEPVQVHAIRLACLLIGMDVLDEEDCGLVYQLIFVKPRAVAHAAGHFTYQYLFEPNRLQKLLEAETKESGRKRRGVAAKKGPNAEACVKLKELVRFFLECGVHETVLYFVDSMWNAMDELRDWRSMIDLLQESDLTNKEEACLVEIMSCCVKRGVGQLGPAGRAYKKMLSGKEKKMFVEQKEEISAQFMAALPQLLTKFDSDAAMVCALTSIPLSFDLSLYPELRHEKQLSELLAGLRRIIFKHSSYSVFYSCAETLRYLQDEDWALLNVVEASSTGLLEQMAKELNDNLKVLEKEELDEETAYPLVVCVRRVAAFSVFFDMNKWNVVAALRRILSAGSQDPDRVPDVIMCAALNCALSTVNHLVLSVEDQQTELTVMHQKHLEELVRRCDELISFSSASIQNAALCVLSDLLIAISGLAKLGNVHLQAVQKLMDSSRQDRCREYIVSNVLLATDEDDSNDATEDSQDERASALNDRRRSLAAYCKLIAYRVFDVKMAAPVMAYYLKSFSDYGDIVKMLISKIREASYSDCAKTMLLALRQMFEDMKLESGGVIDRQSQEWIALKELAHRFSHLTGVDSSKASVREMSITIHRDGIVYSLSRVQSASQQVQQADPDVPANLIFLEVLQELTGRLTAFDKHRSEQSVLKFLDNQLSQSDHLPSDILEQLDQPRWQSLCDYRAALAGGATQEKHLPPLPMDDDDDGGDQASLMPPPKKPRGQGASKAVGKKRRASSQTEGVWLQRPSEAEVRQQKKEKARAARARASRSTRQAKPRSRPPAGVGRKRQRELSPSPEIVEEKPSDKEEEDAEEDSDSVPPSSQASWISSQPKRKKPFVRRSYGDTRSPLKSSRVGQTGDATSSPSNPRTRSRRAGITLPQVNDESESSADDLL